LDIKTKDKNKEFKEDYHIIAIDSTGIKVNNMGKYVRDK
jgi:hypothetical protein